MTVTQTYAHNTKEDEEDILVKLEDTELGSAVEVLTPGTILREHRKLSDLSQQKLAKMIGESKQTISNMESGISPIGKEMAMRLSVPLNTDYRCFL